jgi:soluble lytic murein transglycosylase-like protein
MAVRSLTWLGAASLFAALLLLALSKQPPPAAAAAAELEESFFARPPAPWHEAAAAFRSGDPATARRLVEPLTGNSGVTAGEARLVLGMWALGERQLDRGVALLQEAADPDGRFEDWRLLALADCYAALDRLPAAAATLSRLLDSRPVSPLRASAALKAAAVAGRLGDRRRVEQLVALGRREQFRPEQTRQLEQAAWQVAIDSGDTDLQREVARRLLVHLPVLASQLEVIELFRQPSGAIEWLSFLSVENLLARTRSLLAVGITAGALDALDAVPAQRRDREWSMLRTEALIMAQRSEEARTLVATLEAKDIGERIRIEILRADAALEAARVRPGRDVPSAAERDRLRGSARQALWHVLELAGDEPAHLEAVLSAHRQLLSHLLDDERFEPALALLRTLRRLDPDDTTGARFLWQRGWREYQNRNPSGAIGYWSELETIYPASRYARSGRYWTARAHEMLGDSERAKTVYREVARVDTEDFYRRHAMRRLTGEPVESGADSPQQPREPWPWDADLARARWLSDHGLDEAALVETNGLSARAEPRAARAFEAVVLARLERRRDSIHAINRAFPQLGSLQQDSAPSEALQLYYPTAFEPLVRRFASAQKIPSGLLFAMIRQESAFDPTAVSRSGARGLMQLMPSTGRELAQRMRLDFSNGRLSDPEFNIRLGSSYFRQLLEMFGGNEELALAGYNGGPYRIKRLWRDEGSAAELDLFLEGLALSETTRYVKRIVLFRDTYDRLDGGRV